MALFVRVTGIPFSTEVNFKEAPTIRIDSLRIFRYVCATTHVHVMAITCGVSKLISAVLKYLVVLCS